MLVTGAVKLPVYNGISCSICIYVVANTKLMEMHAACTKFSHRETRGGSSLSAGNRFGPGETLYPGKHIYHCDL